MEKEIVIKISENTYKAICKGCMLPPYGENVVNAIKNGTPLPKGHGDLIDRNELLEYTDINECAYIPTINRYDIITAQTIIEADKESKE